MIKETVAHSFSFSGFDRLMNYRIRDILLVASLYDSFIVEQDGHLTELLLSEYTQLNLSAAPLVTRVSSGEEALEALDERRFDLVITMSRLGGMELIDFGKRAKELRVDMPVVLMVYNPRELAFMQVKEIKPYIDRVFIWRGDVRIILAIIKSVEDQVNVGPDTAEGSVRCILLVEDSVRFYSSYLPILYTELLYQTQALMADGIDLMDRLLRMRARPKILLAENFEEAEHLFDLYRDSMLGVIADSRFERDGKNNEQAGVELVRLIKSQDPDMPVLMQSSQENRLHDANKLGVAFLHKESPTLLKDLRGFMKSSLGFGDFVFTMPNGATVGRASDLSDMLRMLRSVPDECLQHHANRNHFSNWFMARMEFRLAKQIRPVKVGQIAEGDTLRDYLLRTMIDHRESSQRGRIEEFSRKRVRGFRGEFLRIGEGSLGGKGRGLAFINALLTRYDLRQDFEDLRVFVPTSAVLATGVFDRFLEDNDLLSVALGDFSDEEISEAFVRAPLPLDVMEDLRVLLEEVHYPLAVRSSSLLEDSQHQPFAGVYNSHMLPNNHPDDSRRLDQLAHAVKLVYASTFYRAAKAYLSATQNRIEEEKMAVIIQHIVGRQYGDYLYPGLAGTAQSYNFYAVHGSRAEDGAASVVLGLGKSVMEGEKSLWFSPPDPHRLPQFGSVDDFLNNSQREFWALDLSNPDIYARIDGDAGLIRLGLDRAEADGTLGPVASVYMPDNDAVYDGISRKGPRLVTLAGVLKGDCFPLARLLQELLELGRLGMASAVEVEFAANLDRSSGLPQEFAILQIRPLVVGREQENLDELCPDDERLLLYSERVLGNGRIDGIRDIVMVDMKAFDRSFTPEVAVELRDLNEKLAASKRPYLLVGPGRWGSRDRWLGIPVSWADISWARVIVETEMTDISVEPSQGSHFFHNLTSFEVGYFTAYERDDKTRMDRSWLEAQEAVETTRFLRHIRLPAALEINLDGRRSRGKICKPPT